MSKSAAHRPVLALRPSPVQNFETWHDAMMALDSHHDGYRVDGVFGLLWAKPWAALLLNFSGEYADLLYNSCRSMAVHDS